MSRRAWVGLAVALLGLLVLGAVGAGGVLFYQAKRVRDWYTHAEELYAKGEWNGAKRNYALYLSKHPDDVPTLRKYAEASVKIVEIRQQALRDAVTAYQQIRRYAPDQRDVDEELLALLEKMESWGDLEYYANQMLSSRPDFELALYYRALALDRSGRRKEAIPVYQELVEQKTQRAAVYGNLARLLREQGLASEAAGVMDRTRQQFPDSVPLRLERVKYSWESGDHASAEAELAGAARLAPDDPDVLAAQVRLAASKQDWNQTVEAGEKLLKIAPEKGEAYLAVAHAYQRRGDADRAIALLQSADPLVCADHPPLLLVLADLQLSRRQLEAARATQETYAKIFPENGAVLGYFQGRERLLQNDAAGAIQKLAAVVERLPNFAPAQYFLAVAYFQDGKEAFARSTLEAYLLKYPHDETAQLLYARQLRRPRSVEEAADWAAQTLADQFADANSLAYQARVLSDMARAEGKLSGQADTIRQLYQAAVARDPKSQVGYQGWAETCLALGDLAEARKALDNAVAAGVSEQRLSGTRVGIALAEKNDGAARTIIASDLARPETTPDQVVGWANLLASRNRLDLAEEVLAQRIAGSDEASRLNLEIERLGLLARSGDLPRTLTQLADLEPRVESRAEPRKALARVKLQIASRLLQENPAADPAATNSVDTAQRLVTEVLQADPENTSGLVLEAQLRLQATPPETEKSRALLEKVISVEPSNVTALLALGALARRQGQLGEAFERIEQAAKADPSSLEVQLRRAELLYDLGRHDEAQTAFEQILAAEETASRLRMDAARRARVLEMLIRSYLANNEMDEAETTLGRLETLAQNDSAYREIAGALRGEMMLRKGTVGEAEPVFRAQYEANPDNLDAVQRLARTLVALKRESEAEDLYKTYTTKHEADPEGWVAQGRFFLSRSNPER
ncbi:MAG: tetratricopeptide repeat protein, partial [Candidatus Hydrogenedentes bacterium]|nr:tetratricopeptide repeat protein [Candidatus Hydrogenedentota bacterium]